MPLMSTDVFWIRKRVRSLHCYVRPHDTRQQHRRSQGGKGSMSPKFLAYPVIWCHERRCRKQNTVARLKTKYLPPQNFGLATLLDNNNIILIW